MTDLELKSAVICGIAALMAIGVVLAAIRMGLDEQREREKAWWDEQ